MVTLIEPLGWEVHVHAMVGEHAVLLQMPAERVEGLAQGSPIGVAVQASDAHLFDPRSGEAWLGAAP